ncbi:MAG: 5-histidylcysteine sulfoxide synthase [Gemmatimonadota bacterium]|nr:5-histidylcysteine sulfoxide synthase [Gemmatimonadota bacterium]
MSAPSQFAERSSLPPRLDRMDPASLRRYFINTWELYEWLFSAIRRDGALYEAPDPLRQPLIFYLGHTAVFYINKLKLAGLIGSGLNEHFEELFAVGVDPAKASELAEEAWPAESEVRLYREDVYYFMLDQIERFDLSGPITDAHPAWAVLMGLEHDRIHFETSSMLIRQYPPAYLGRPEGWEYGPEGGPAPTPRMIDIEGGDVRLGKPDAAQTFGWDSDYGKLDVVVGPFAVGRDPVTNGEFMEFVREGGYETQGLWTDEGWAWRTETDARHPRFWVHREGDFQYRAMFDLLAMPESWPVEVNALEAAAFCAWRGDGARLPTEAEFQLLAASAPQVDGDCLFSDAYNLNLVHGSPTPVGLSEAGRTGDGLNDLFGNVWEWLADDFAGLPGFEAHRLYRDFSEPFMDSDHSMLAGCSWASSGVGASRYYRLWFRRNFFQHAGFRIAR